MNRELLQQALDVLKSEYSTGGTNKYSPYEVMKALEAELAKPEQAEKQKPVAYYWRDTKACYWIADIPLEDLANLDVSPLYTSPPRTELARPEQKPVAWNENVDEMPINTYCKAVVDWYSYSTDGDSFLEGRDVQVIVVKYKLNEDEDDIVLIHEGNNQYEYTRCDVLKWKPLYTSSPRKKWVGLTDEEIKNILDCRRGGLVDIKKAEAKLKEKNT